MTPDEVVKVLVRVQADDNRDVGQVTVASWQQTIGHLNFQDAIEAVVMHRVERPDVWLMPGHVVSNVKLLQSRRRGAVERAESIERQHAINASVAAPEEFDRAAHEAEFGKWRDYYREHPEER